jgi:hypothetical protein
MPNQYKKIEVQLYEQAFGSQAAPIITDSGGKFIVVANGGAAKQAIYDSAGAAASNPVSMTYGKGSFYVLDTVTSVDIYGIAPGGQWFFKTGAKEGIVEIGIDVQNREQVYKIPFSAVDSTAATEYDTGFDLPLYSAVMPNPMILVTTIDATEDIDVGILSSETAGDADGFIDGVSTATLGLAKATLLTSADTMGALLSVQDSANAGDDAPEVHVVTGSNGRSISYTTSAGSDTAAGFILLNVVLGA